MGDHAPTPPKRRPGRPPVAPVLRREIPVTTFLTVREHNALCADARRADMTLAAMLREPFTDPRDR
jgi:hypothetical protein